jgi:alcohol dehydrogenase
MPPFDFQPGTRVIFGEHTIDRLGPLTKELGGRRVLVVTDAGLIGAGHVERARHSLEQEAILTGVFSEVEENPTTRHVDNGVQFAKENSPIDLIIALGGGSAMDCAKGINFLLSNGGTMEDYWGFGKAMLPLLPSIGIPTTAGTGSEAQSYALIVHEHTYRKMACGDVKARFRTVILDPALLTSVPRSVAAVTGIDAMAHAIESHVCTRANALSRMFSREAWRLLERNFIKILQEPDDIIAQGEMLLGAHLAGMAIENSMLGAAHACANPLTARYGVTHGVAVGLMLPHVIRFNSQASDDAYADLLRTAGLRTKEQTSSGERLSERMAALKAEAGLPQRLRDCSVDRASLTNLAQMASLEWTGPFNPRPVTTVELLELYEAAF